MGKVVFLMFAVLNLESGEITAAMVGAGGFCQALRRLLVFNSSHHTSGSLLSLCISPHFKF